MAWDRHDYSTVSDYHDMGCKGGLEGCVVCFFHNYRACSVPVGSVHVPYWNVGIGGIVFKITMEASFDDENWATECTVYGLLHALEDLLRGDNGVAHVTVKEEHIPDEAL